jgi:hypothetical protein
VRAAEQIIGLRWLISSYCHARRFCCPCLCCSGRVTILLPRIVVVRFTFLMLTFMCADAKPAGAVADIMPHVHVHPLR